MNRAVIVTGAAQGIGRVITGNLLAQAWRVIAIDADAEAIAELRESHGHLRLEAYEGDVADQEFVHYVIHREAVMPAQQWALVNNAAIAANKPIAELSFEEWTRVLHVNLSSVFLWTQAMAGLLQKYNGAVVNIASTRALMSEPNTEAYTASKGGVLALTHSLAMSLAPVRVNAISPGWIETRHLQKKSKAVVPTYTANDTQQHPVGRVGKAEDVAYMVSYLLSERAGFITGQNFVIDGGMTHKMIYAED